MFEPNQLLQTKFYRPQINAALVARSHLLARLDAGLRHKLILISAPPGFGKTTLAGQWLASEDRPSAWLSLDEGDNDAAQFLRYFCATVSRVAPGICAALQELLTTASLPGIDYLTDRLLVELNVLPEALVVVLDDYHLIQAAEVHHILRQLLRHRPPPLHLVILSRRDPPLYLESLRMSQEITEIRAADLRFGLVEARRFLHAYTDHPLDDAALQSVLARTEGWVIGLQLAGISLKNQSPDQFLAHFSGDHRLLTVYLVEEVMAGLPAAMREFLTRTALTTRFCAPLGDALLADTPWKESSQTIIAQLEAYNLFITPLDDTGNWYRYHDLFREFLLHQLKNAQGVVGTRILHRRASQWFAQAGLIEDALRHSLAAADQTNAAELIELNLHPLLNQHVPAIILARWLSLFPEEAIQTHPGLLTAQVYLFAFRWNVPAMAAAVSRANALVQADTRVNPERHRLRLGNLAALEGYAAYWQGDLRRAAQLLQRGLDELADPVAYRFVRAQMIHLLAQVHAQRGQPAAAHSLLRAALAEATAYDQPTTLLFLISQALIQIYAGHLTAAVPPLEQALARAERQTARRAWSDVALVRVWLGWANYFLGAIDYEHNNFERAAQRWRRVEAWRYQVNPGAFQDSLVGLALIAQARGETAQALDYTRTVHESAEEMRSAPLLALAAGLEARLALQDGRQGAAWDYAQAINTAANQANTFWLEEPRLTVMRVWLSDASRDSLRAALQLAETCLNQAESVANTHQVIQILARQALIWQALGHYAKALTALEQAMVSAEPGGFMRTFLDLGAPMAELLRHLERRRTPSPYMTRLLSAFALELDAPSPSPMVAPSGNPTLLTPRELELLALIAQRLSVKEMAQRLQISPNTIKKHINSIYTKLEASNRRQAIARAEEEGLLPLP